MCGEAEEIALRRLAVLSVFSLLFMAFGCAGGQDEAQVQSPSPDQNTEEESKSAQPNQPEQEGPKKTLGKETKEEPALINLSGNGATATDPFDLESGLAIFRMSYMKGK